MIVARVRLVVLVFCLLIAGTTAWAQSTVPAPAAADNGKPQPQNSPQSLQWDGNLLIREFQLAIGHPLVGKELGLLPYQIEQLKETLYELQTSITDAVREYSRVGAGERNKQLQAVYASAREAAERVLLPRQTQRLRQIAIQSLGASGQSTSTALVILLQNPMVRGQVDLSESDLKNLQEKAKTELEKLEQEIQALRERANQEILSELPTAARQKIEDLVGVPFDFGNYELGRNGVIRRGDDK